MDVYLIAINILLNLIIIISNVKNVENILLIVQCVRVKVFVQNVFHVIFKISIFKIFYLYKILNYKIY